MASKVVRAGMPISWTAAARDAGILTLRDHPRSRCARGFTLLELAIVMFIMGLVMLIAMPYFGGFQGSQLKSEARRLASRTNYLYEEAGAQKVLLRLTFDLDHNGYRITR